MKQDIKKRIDSLRKEISSQNISAFIIPSTDPHLSEYVADYWKIREWISGFTGSAGTVVILKNKAGLWTDSRYFLQATEQLEGTGITLFREGLTETPSIAEFLIENLKPNDSVGVDGLMFSVDQIENLSKQLRKHSIEIKDCDNLIDNIWINRPILSQAAPFKHDMAHAGKSCDEKLSEICSILEKDRIDGLFISALDEIAWTLNLRGNDIEYNPLFIAYLYISRQQTTLFIDARKITTELKMYLKDVGVQYASYNETASFLNDLENKTILMQPSKTNYTMFMSVGISSTIVRKESPITFLKSIRNDIEKTGIKEAMIRDGVAMVRFLNWLDQNIASGNETEISISQKLDKFRELGERYIGNSFNTIAGYQEHGAIVHYTVDEKSNATLQPKGFLLLDSGAQYLDGTTDITRTIALGPLTDEQKKDYTLVLKGHIGLAMAQFPAGTRGAQLDVLARLPLWMNGMNYLHGTGHGVGHFLNVHEGPQSIRMNENPVILQPGMVTSNEPGVYKTDQYGIRIENLIMVTEASKGMYGDYYKFETLTLCPICQKGIIKELLNKEEMDWLNNYHSMVYQLLGQHLNKEDKEWLEKATQPIK